MLRSWRIFFGQRQRQSRYCFKTTLMTEAFTPLDQAGREELRQIASDSYARGDLAEAIDIQRKVLASGPADADDTLVLALMLFAARDVPAAMSVLRDGIEHFPNVPALHENLAVCLVTSGEFAASVASCRQAFCPWISASFKRA